MANPIITLTDPKTGEYFYQEAIKTLRTNLQFSGKNTRAILITSVFSGEGKSDISFHLAAELGKIGKKVLLVDTDIRKSAYKERYGITEEVKGLSQYLSGQVDKLVELIYRTNYENLHMILAGPAVPNPIELLEDDQFGELVKAAKQVYDYVIIDTPPLGTVIDAAVVSKACDGAMIVIESGAVSYRQAQKVLRQLEVCECRVLGTVLNKVNMKTNPYYGGKYGKYGKYGGAYGKYNERS